MRDSITESQPEKNNAQSDWHPSRKVTGGTADDSSDTTSTVWFVSWRKLAGLLSEENRALLLLMHERQPCTVLELVQWSGRVASNLSRTLRHLERHGLANCIAVRTRVPCDPRRWPLSFWSCSIDLRGAEMKFEVNYDEANPDVLTAANPRVRHHMISSLWRSEELRNEIKSRVSVQQHIDWIKATLGYPTAALFEGWDKNIAPPTIGR